MYYTVYLLSLRRPNCKLVEDRKCNVQRESGPIIPRSQRPGASANDTSATQSHAITCHRALPMLTGTHELHLVRSIMAML